MATATVLRIKLADGQFYEYQNANFKAEDGWLIISVGETANEACQPPIMFSAGQVLFATYEMGPSPRVRSV
jgi:hypothetical protein